MDFILMFLMNRDALPDAKVSHRCYVEMCTFADDLKNAGKLKFDSQLRPEAEGARVALDGGRPLVCDGPFAETREVCGGFFLITARDRDEAIEIAKRCPHLQVGSVEVRQLNTSGTDAYADD